MHVLSMTVPQVHIFRQPPHACCKHTQILHNLLVVLLGIAMQSTLSSLRWSPLPQRSARPAPRLSARARDMSVRASKTESGPSVAIAGVTGAVGQEFLRVCCGGMVGWCTSTVYRHSSRLVLIWASQVLNERQFPYSKIKMLASKRCVQDEIVKELSPVATMSFG